MSIPRIVSVIIERRDSKETKKEIKRKEKKS